MGLGIGQIYLTLMIDGVGSRPFSAETIPPIESPPISYRDDVIRSSREQYSRPRAEMEAQVMKRQKDFALQPKVDQRRPRDGERPRGSGAPHMGDRGRRERDARPQADVRPREHVQQFPERAAPPPPPREAPPQSAGQRDALRAAIAAAHPIPSAPPARTPADIMRERLAKKPPPRAPEPPQSRPMPPVPPAGEERNDEASRRGKGEVSPEVLQKVLRGDETHE